MLLVLIAVHLGSRVMLGFSVLFRLTRAGFLLQVLCIEFEYLTKMIPYIPTDRPLVMLDAGANAGFASVLFARFMRFQGQLVSVEMNPESARMLRRNMAPAASAPGFCHRVVNKALVSTTEEREQPEMKFLVDEGHFMSNKLATVVGHSGGKNGNVVRTVSLPTLLVRSSSRPPRVPTQRASSRACGVASLLSGQGLGHRLLHMCECPFNRCTKLAVSLYQRRLVHESGSKQRVYACVSLAGVCLAVSMTPLTE